MDFTNIDIDMFCKNEILAEISFHNKKLEIKTIKLLCSRLLARHLPRKFDRCSNVLEQNLIDETNAFNENPVKEHIATDNKNEPLVNDGKHCTMHVLNEQNTDCIQQVVPCSENTCLDVQEQFTNLSTNECAENAKWYAYWESNGENFVNETWIKQYGSCTTDELPMDVEELYKVHCEQQYHVLYWKFINEMCCNTEEFEDHNSDNYSSSSSNEDLNDVDYISNFNFLHKYKNFDQVNSKLLKAYRALSLMGHVYDNQNSFDSAYVEYLKTNLIKSTRHLNIYRFPKMMELKQSETDSKPLNSNMDSENINTCDHNEQGRSLITGNMSVSNSNGSVKKRKKILKKEKFKEAKAMHLDEELKRSGYSYLQNNCKLLKYWKKRYVLFSEFEKGIQLDEESWYSVTPEVIGKFIANRCSCYLLVDPFCGAGGNVIQFAKTCELVIAIDIDPKKIEMARHNAEIYGVADRIQFIVGDYYTLAPTLKADVVFLSPPWGGPHLMDLEDYKLSRIMPENGGGEHLLSLTRQITPDIALHLPKNINIFDCINLANNGFVEVQQNILNSRYNSITVYYNELYGLCDDTN